MNFINKLINLYKRKLVRHKNSIFFRQLLEIMRNKLIICLSIPTPGFLHFYYILGANLGSNLHGDVSVMVFELSAH